MATAKSTTTTKRSTSSSTTKKSTTGITKTVMEWLYEMKLYAQKIDKCKDDLNKTYLFYASPTILKDSEAEEKTIHKAKSLWDKYTALTANYEKIKQAIIEFNATTKIMVADKEYSIARALELYKKDYNYEFLVKLLNNQYSCLENRRIDLVKVQSTEVSQLESKLLAGLAANKNDSKIQSQLETRRTEYTPYIIEAIPVYDNYQRVRDEHVAFINQVNAQINIANVNNSLTIDLA